ncbi:MAG: hypothetical protein WC713_03990 [Candidatus Methylomirabilota bacterium]
MHIWIVEMKCGKKWEPCACANLKRKDAEREKIFYWEHNNPTDEFRVKKYVPGYVTPNVELTGAAPLYGAASSDRRERG